MAVGQDVPIGLVHHGRKAGLPGRLREGGRHGGRVSGAVGLLGLIGTTARVRGPISALISATGGTKPALAIRSTSGSIVVGLNETSDVVLEGQRSGLRALDR